MTLRLALALCLALSALPSCGAGAGTQPERKSGVEFPITLGVWSPADSVFSELAEGATVDVFFGFQGLIFIDLALLADVPIPARFSVRGTVTFDDTGDVIPLIDNYLLFETQPGGARVVPSFRVPVAGAGALQGRPVMLAVRFESQDGAWCAELEQHLVLHDGGCTHNPDGTFTCR